MKLYVANINEKCAGCNWESSVVYLLANSQEEANELYKEYEGGLCGECIAEMLMQDGYEIRRLKMDEKYYGWANRETWALFRCLTREESLYSAVKEEIIYNDEKAGFCEKRDGIKNFVEDLQIEAEKTGDKELFKMFNNVGSLWRVDWDEIARAFIDK